MTTLYFILIFFTLGFVFSAILDRLSKKLFLSLLIISVLGSSFVIFNNRDLYETFKTEINKKDELVNFKTIITVQGVKDIKEEAKKAKKPLFLLFYRETCDHCVKLERTTLAADKIVNKLNEDFISVKVDISEDTNDTKKLIKMYEVEGTPTFIFFDRDGEFDGKDYGYQTEEEFFDTIDLTTD